MVKGKVAERQVFLEKPQVNYRKLNALNQSMLKKFDEDPIRFFDEFKMGKKRVEKKNVAKIIGDLVDFFVLQCKGDEECFNNRLDERFSLVKGKIGSGQVFELADQLFEETIFATNTEGEVSTTFDERFGEAFRKMQDKGKYKGKTCDQALADFEKNGKEYYDLKISDVDKVVVDNFLINKSLSIGLIVMHDEWTKDIFSGNDDLEYLTHYPIEWVYKIDEKREVACKSEVDAMLIDHEKRIIQPFDLKTSFDNENFDYMYLKNKYYLQNAFYYYAVKYWKEQQEGMENYAVMPMKFIVGDTSMNNRRPLVYSTIWKDIENGMNGFAVRGQEFRGVKQLIEAIAWAEETGNWNVDKVAFDNGGKMQLNVQYD